MVPIPSPQLEGAPLAETRAVWLNPPAFSSRQAQTGTLDAIQAANLNTIFLASYTLGDNGGWSEQRHFDRLFEQARTDGYRVHVWLNSIRRKGGGENGGPLVDYADAGEQQTHRQWCLDWLAAYPDLAGVHFDNLRYPTSAGSIDERGARGIADTVKGCYEAVKDRYPGKLITAFVDNIDPKPIAPGDRLPQWFEEWVTAHPDNDYIFDGVQHRPSNSRIDPIGWLKGGYMDAVTPGDYTPSLELWRRRLPNWRSFLGRLDGVWFGVAWMPEKEAIVYPDGQVYPGGGADAAVAVAQIKYARAEGMRGFSIFQLGKGDADDATLAAALGTDGAINDFDAPFKHKAAG